MSRFDVRSSEKELIDQPGIPFADWEICLRELNTVNTFLGGHSITLEGVRRIMGTKAAASIAEIGCGGGDNLLAIHRRYNKGITKFTGIDLNEACIRFAENNCRNIPAANFVCSDYRNVTFASDKPDIIFNSLFCHHFSENEIVDMLTWMKQNSRAGFFINDLQRHPLAYHSIKMLTAGFSRSYLVKNDAPVSVARGFVKQDWTRMLNKAGIVRYSIDWRWAFRYLVIVTNE